MLLGIRMIFRASAAAIELALSHSVSNVQLTKELAFHALAYLTKKHKRDDIPLTDVLMDAIWSVIVDEWPAANKV